MTDVDKHNDPKIDYQFLAQQLFQAGFEPIPIPPSSKQCLYKGWPTMQLPIDPWPEGHGIGLRTGNHIAIDIDVLDPGIVGALLTHVKADHEIITRTGKAPKVLIPVLCPEIGSKTTSNRYIDVDGNLNCIEVLAAGQFYVAHGIHPDIGKPYYWDGDLLTHTLPTMSLEEIQELFNLFDEYAEDAEWTNLNQKEKQIAEKRGDPATHKPADPLSTRPGDLLNAVYPITELLELYGWKPCGEGRWTRPGKDPAEGPSGTVFDDSKLYVFSTSIPELQAGQIYDAFAIFTHYSHGGDFSAAAREIERESR